MPRLRRRAKSRKSDFAELSIDQEMALLTGLNYFNDSPFPRIASRVRNWQPENENVEAFAAAWEIHRDRLLNEFIAKHPGRRPFAWWALDHKKERPILGELPADQLALIRRQHTHYGYFHTEILGKFPEWSYLQEPQEEYLARKRLLREAEIEALKELADADPDTTAERGPTARRALVALKQR
jgi:hypothetical protein